MLDLHPAELIPQYIQACEHDDLTNPGTVAHVHLRLGGGINPPDRVTLSRSPLELAH